MENIFTFLAGSWFICFSNFPMWTKGNKTNPTFNYVIIRNKQNITVLSDEVRYIKQGKEKSIKGIDTQSTSDEHTFIWRGNGLLKLLTSTWKVALRDEENGQWAVIYFSKTLFTPAGVDIISRKSTLSIDTWEQIRFKMSVDPLLANHLLEIKDIK